MDEKVEHIQQHLPQYLSLAETTELLRQIDEQFPDIHPSRMYTAVHAEEKIIYQGDGIADLLYVYLPYKDRRPYNCMVFSNTCDMDLSNPTQPRPAICYAPIIRLDKFSDALAHRLNWTPEQIGSRLQAIRSQRITTVFYLPKGGLLGSESVVLMDRICHCASDSIRREEIPSRRLFTLSQIGAYLFFFKLSVHLLRMTDKVERSISP